MVNAVASQDESCEEEKGDGEGVFILINCYAELDEERGKEPGGISRMQVGIQVMRERGSG